jgi:hypothetical protein
VPSETQQGFDDAAMASTAPNHCRHSNCTRYADAPHVLTAWGLQVLLPATAESRGAAIGWDQREDGTRKDEPPVRGTRAPNT